MTNMKKVLGAGLAIATMFGFAACGSSTNAGSSSKSNPVKLTVWSSSEDQKAGGWIQAMEKAFKKGGLYTDFNKNVTLLNAAKCDGASHGICYYATKEHAKLA